MNTASRRTLLTKIASRLLLPAMALTAILLLCVSPAAARDQDPAIAAAASSYLQARAEQALPGARVASLEPFMAPGSAAWPVERLVAVGARLDWKTWGISPLSVDCTCKVKSMQLSSGGEQAIVQITATVATHWADDSGVPHTSEDTTDHTLVLKLARGSWLVARDDYLSVLTPGELEAGGAAPALVRKAAQKLEAAQRAEVPSQLPQRVSPVTSPDTDMAITPITPHRYVIFYYDRRGAAKYADAHTSSSAGNANYNPDYHDFTPDGGDCTNFTSQCMFLGGGYPALGNKSSGFNVGWWYDNSAGFPYCSVSWRAANAQRTYWNTKYTTDVPSINNLSTGDYIYYDTDHDGAVEHAAIVDAVIDGKRYIAAHTGNHLRYYPWYLSSSYTPHFSCVKSQIVWPMWP